MMDIKIKPVPYRNYCRGAGSLAMPGSIVHVSESVWYQNPRFYFFIFLIAMMWYVSPTKPTDNLLNPDQTVIIKPVREQIVEKEANATVKQVSSEAPAEVIEEMEKKQKPVQQILKKPHPAEVSPKKEALSKEPRKKVLPEKPFENQITRKNIELDIPQHFEKRVPAPVTPKPRLAGQPARKLEQKPAIITEKISEKRIAGNQFESKTLQRKKVRPKVEEPRGIDPKTIGAPNQRFKALAYNEKDPVTDTRADVDEIPKRLVAAPETIEAEAPDLAGGQSAQRYTEVDMSSRRVDFKSGLTPSDVKVNENPDYDNHYAEVDARSDRLSKITTLPAEAAGSSSLPAGTEVQLTISNAISGESMRIDNLKQKIYSAAKSMSPEKCPYCCTIGKYKCIVTIGKNHIVRIDFTPTGDVPFDVVSKLEREIHYKRMTQCSD